MSILMSIHAEHLANIYAWKKTVELRKNKPKEDHHGEYIWRDKTDIILQHGWR